MLPLQPVSWHAGTLVWPLGILTQLRASPGNCTLVHIHTFRFWVVGQFKPHVTVADSASRCAVADVLTPTIVPFARVLRCNTGKKQNKILRNPASPNAFAFTARFYQWEHINLRTKTMCVAAIKTMLLSPKQLVTLCTKIRLTFAFTVQTCPAHINMCTKAIPTTVTKIASIIVCRHHLLTFASTAMTCHCVKYY